MLLDTQVGSVRLASNYRKEGLTWQEANKKAYEELYAEFADYASRHPRQTPQG